MDGKIIAFPTVSHSSPISQLDDAEIAFSCSVIALDFAGGKSIPDLSAEWELDEHIIVEVLQSEIQRMCPAADRLRYQLAIADC